MNNSIAINLRRFRTIRKMTQEKAAAKAGISRVAYRAIETGKAEPRVATLDAIARALATDVFALVAKTPEPKTLRFRAHSTLTAQERAERQQLIVDTLEWVADFNELEDMLKERPKVRIEPASRKPADIARFAESVRRDNFGISCEDCVPNVCDVLEQGGVKVRIVQSHIKGLFGFSVGADDGGPAVAVNAAEPIPVERQIFTAAHELGHLLLHQDSFNPEVEKEDARQEREADLFASHFLMPQDAFKAEWDRNMGLHWVDRVLKTKRTFRVSWMTVLYRLCETGLADKRKIFWQFKTAFEQRTGGKLNYKREPEPLVPTSPRRPAEEPVRLNEYDFYEDRFALLVRQALIKNEISVSRSAEMLRMSIGETRELLAEWEAHP
ncbi:MAG: ImmA/IrrE family metallo-endopeptidase [Kiritimatiellae bacterium]|nr:ImmA/IrrE family metallo-endopeptidase [Kiritimatiellia bacterium]